MKKFAFLALIISALISCKTDNHTNHGMIQSMVYSSAQIDEANLSEFNVGSSRYSDMRAEFMTTPDNFENESKRSKISILLRCVDNIETETDEIIRKIEKLKIDLLKKSNVRVDQLENQNPKIVFWRKYDPKNKSLPSQLNLAALQSSELTYTLSDLLVSDDPLSLTKTGKDLWNSLQKFRLNIVNAVGVCSMKDPKTSLNLKSINQFDSNKSLHEQVDLMIAESGADLYDDRFILVDMYLNLTKPEFEMYNGSKTHWINVQFQNATLLSVLLTLNSIENEILRARSLAMAHIGSKISYCGYGFNKILALTNGPSLAYEGEEVALQVSIGAFDSYNQPFVKVNDITSKIDYKNGLGIIRFKPKKGIQTITGTVSIRNKSGIMTTKPWEWKINVLKRN
jgi:hypothetical protein